MRWDIVARGPYTDEIRYKAAPVPTGRFMSRREAASRAGEINSFYVKRPVDKAWRNVMKHVETKREWPSGWWKKAAEEYNRRHGRNVSNESNV